MPPSVTKYGKFQSTRPSRGETSLSAVRMNAMMIFQSTRPSRGETILHQGKPEKGNDFNPLAPRGARPMRTLPMPWPCLISIHSPLAGRDCSSCAGQPTPLVFQSTRPSRGETYEQAQDALVQFISIHSPLAGRDVICDTIAYTPYDFNPLAPRGARLLILLVSGSPCKFQSTRPSRGETTTP